MLGQYNGHLASESGSWLAAAATARPGAAAAAAYHKSLLGAQACGFY